MRVFPLLLLLIATNTLNAQVKEYRKQRINDDAFVYFSEIPPEYPGGTKALLKFIAENTIYPTLARENNIEGKVLTTFTVNIDGSVSNINVIKGRDPSLDAEAIRIVSLMPKWEPGIQNGKPLKVNFILPVTFRLENNDEIVDELIAYDNDYIRDRDYLKFLGDSVRYPIQALQKGIREVIIRATYDVNSEGEISNIKITESEDRSLSNEVLRLIKKIPEHLALARTGGKETNDVHFRAMFLIREQRPSVGSAFSGGSFDIIVAAVRLYCLKP